MVVMPKCKYQKHLECELFDEPESICWYENLEDCLCFRTGKYKSIEDLGEYVEIEFFEKHKYIHSFTKRLLLRIWRKQR